MEDRQCIFCDHVMETENDECICSECLNELDNDCSTQHTVILIVIITGALVLMSILF